MRSLTMAISLAILPPSGTALPSDAPFATPPAAPPAGWVAISPPQTDEDWLCANYCTEEWLVERSGDSVVMSTPPPERPQPLSLHDGTLSGENRGEFGGRVLWRDSRTRVVSQILSDNPVAFFTVGNRVFLAADGPRDGGYILELTRQGLKWKSHRVLDLSVSPRAVTNDAGANVLVATVTGVVRVNVHGGSSGFCTRTRGGQTSVRPRS